MVTSTSVRAQADEWFQQNWDPDAPLGTWWQRLADSGWGFPRGRSNGSDEASIVISR